MISDLYNSSFMSSDESEVQFRMSSPSAGECALKSTQLDQPTFLREDTPVPVAQGLTLINNSDEATGINPETELAATGNNGRFGTFSLSATKV